MPESARSSKQRASRRPRSTPGARASPRPTASFEAASAATCAHLARGEELLGRLPRAPRPERGRSRGGRCARRRRSTPRARGSCAPTSTTVYAALTDDLRRAVRDEELVYAAAERFPGLVPTRAQMAAERASAAARQGGRRDRAGPVPLVRARVAALRRAPRLVDAAPDGGGARAPRRVPRDRRRRSRRDVSRAPRAGGVSRDPQRPPPERGGLRHAARPPRSRSIWRCSTPRSRWASSAARSSATRATPAGASSARASTSRISTTAASTTCSSSRATSAT